MSRHYLAAVILSDPVLDVIRRELRRVRTEMPRRNCMRDGVVRLPRRSDGLRRYMHRHGDECDELWFLWTGLSYRRDVHERSLRLSVGSGHVRRGVRRHDE